MTRVLATLALGTAIIIFLIEESVTTHQTVTLIHNLASEVLPRLFQSDDEPGRRDDNAVDFSDES